MHPLEHTILQEFQNSPSKEKSTSELVRLMPEWDKAENALSSSDVQRQKYGKDHKARLHRKLLYHVNKLVADGLLIVAGTQGRGEKRYALALGAGDVEITSGRKQIRIHKPTSINTPIDEISCVHVHDREHWIEKANAVLVEGTQCTTLAEASEKIVNVAGYVNDVIGLLRTDSLLATTMHEYEVFLDRLVRLECKIVLIISLQFNSDTTRIVRFCKKFAEKSPKNIRIAFTVTSQAIQDHKEDLAQIIESFAEKNIKISVKNSGTHIPPVICGRLGPYAITPEDWQKYCEQRNKVNGMVLSGATITVDLAEGDRPHKISRKAAEALFLVGRKRTLDALQQQGYSLGMIDDTIRLWNFNLSTDTCMPELEAANEVVNEFCQMQERIYRACGMPIRTRMRLRSSFDKKHQLSPRRYRKKTVYGISSLQDKGVLEYFRSREKACSVFGADRVRVFRGGDVNPSDVIREISFLLYTFNLPYITYDFRGLRGDQKLTEFIAKKTMET